GPHEPGDGVGERHELLAPAVMSERTRSIGRAPGREIVHANFGGLRHHAAGAGGGSFTNIFTMMKTTSAMMRKSSIAPRKSPTPNLTAPTEMVAVRQSPEGVIAPMIGMMRSATSAATSF